MKKKKLFQDEWLYLNRRNSVFLWITLKWRTEMQSFFFLESCWAEHRAQCRGEKGNIPPFHSKAAIFGRGRPSDSFSSTARANSKLPHARVLSEWLTGPAASWHIPPSFTFLHHILCCTNENMEQSILTGERRGNSNGHLGKSLWKVALTANTL